MFKFTITKSEEKKFKKQVNNYKCFANGAITWLNTTIITIVQILDKRSSKQKEK